MGLAAGQLVGHWADLPPLGEREVQVFLLRVGEDPGLSARAELLLSPAELERAARFRVPGARDEFVAGRAALRVLSASVLGTEAKSVALQVQAYGKPFVPGVHSTVSHSRGVVFLALCRAAEVGIDVEWIDPQLEAMELAGTNFTDEEIRAVAAQLPGWRRAQAFCQLWTRKEAVAKACGQGLRIPLRDIRVPHVAEGTALLAAEPTPAGQTWEASGAGEEFFVQDLAAPVGYAAALAIRGAALPVTVV